MRIVGALIGSMLVATGLVTPLPNAPALEDTPMKGAAVFKGATYEGTARILADEGGFFVDGTLRAAFRARGVSLTIYEYSKNVVGTTVGGEPAGAGLAELEEPRRVRFENATLTVDSWERGDVYFFSNATLPQSRFDVTVSPTPRTDIHATPGTVSFESGDERFGHTLFGPFFGVAHNDPESGANWVASGRIRDFRLSGGMNVFVDYANLTVEHEGGLERFELGEWASDDAAIPLVPGVRGAYAVLAVETVDASFPLQDSRVNFLALEPTYLVDGRVTFTASDGQVAVDNRTRGLRDDEVSITGDVAMRLAGIRVSSVQVRLGERPLTRADVAADADELTINGKSAIALPPPPAPSHLTLIEIAIGAVLVAWSASKALVSFLIGLRIKSPLANRTRRDVFDAIRRGRLVHLRGLQRELGVPVGTLSYHLSILRHAGAVSTVTLAGYRVYFVPDARTSRDEMKRLALLADPTRRRIAEIVAREEGVSQGDLASALGLTRASISRQLARMQRAGVIERQGKRGSVYRAAPLLREWLHDPKAPASPVSKAPPEHGLSA